MMPPMNYVMMVCILFLSACAGKHEEASGSAKADYQHAQELMDTQHYARATIFLEKFSSKHPYSEYATQAELLRIDAAYADEEYILSETLALRFLKRHPRHPRLAYVRYMLAMSYVHESGALERDQVATHHAVDALKDVLKYAPDSKYAQVSRQHLQNMLNKLAAHEVYVGKFYFDHERYVAAANRFQVVLKDYQITPSIEEGLYYLAASYKKLHLEVQAKEVIALLAYNYPKSVWREKASAL